MSHYSRQDANPEGSVCLSLPTSPSAKCPSPCADHGRHRAQTPSAGEDQGAVGTCWEAGPLHWGPSARSALLLSPGLSGHPHAPPCSRDPDCDRPGCSTAPAAATGPRVLPHHAPVAGRGPQLGRRQRTLLLHWPPWAVGRGPRSWDVASMPPGSAITAREALPESLWGHKLAGGFRGRARLTMT